MKTDYVFWCRHCKKDHGGECPPKEEFPKGFTISLKSEKPRSVTIHRAGHSPITIPAIGTVWRYESTDLSGTWIDSGVLVQVVAVAGDRVDYNFWPVISQSAGVYHQPLESWDAAGREFDPVTHQRDRMVAYP